MPCKRTASALVLDLLLASLAPPASAISQRCLEFGPQDAILVVDPQNCFMNKRPVNEAWPLEYQVPKASCGTNTTTPAGFVNWDSRGGDDGQICAGGLWVSNAAEIIPVVNEWLNTTDQTPSQIFMTLDYHPDFHCSFCDTYTEGILPTTYCISGNGSVKQAPPQRCMDAISESDYSTVAPYYQWPAHCVAGTFGARVDPHIQVPNRTVVIKLGTEQMSDSYSAFDGGRTSTAPPGQHDTQADSTDLTMNDTLAEHLSRMNVSRLFIMGLATDFVVDRTLVDALASDAVFGVPNVTVALVEPGSRGINPSKTNDVLEFVSRQPNGVVLYESSPAAAMVEMCSDGRLTCACRSNLPLPPALSPAPGPLRTLPKELAFSSGSRCGVACATSGAHASRAP